METQLIKCFALAAGIGVAGRVVQLAVPSDVPGPLVMAAVTGAGVVGSAAYVGYSLFRTQLPISHLMGVGLAGMVAGIGGMVLLEGAAADIRRAWS